MHPFAELKHLSPDQWERLQDLADRFEAAWKGAESADLRAYLPPPDDALHAIAIQELIKSDLEIRWRRGLVVGLEYYCERLPALGSLQDLPAGLIYEEYRVRQLYGDKPPLASYKTRFPKQFDELQKLIRAQPIRSPVPAATPVETPTANTTTPAADKRVLTVGGGYQLVKRIGSGGFGEVWRAEAPGGVEVAVKIIYRSLDHAEARRELEAVELIKRLRHPFLLQTHAFRAEEDRLFIVMDLAEGSLRDRLKECREAGMPGIPVVELVNYFREAAEGLDYLHSEHVHHRDIKPDNILLLKRHARLADFGLARVMESRMATATGSGTPAYMAPEIWQGKVSQHSDQYSLALTFAELRLNRRIFASRTPAETMMDHLQRTPDLEPLPKSEQEVLLKALAKDPEQRFTNCQEFMESLEAEVAAGMGYTSLRGSAVRNLQAAKSQAGGASTRTTGMTTLAALPATAAEMPTPSGGGQETLLNKMQAATPAWRGDTKPAAKPRSFARVWLILPLLIAVAAGGWWLVNNQPSRIVPDRDAVVIPPDCTAAADAQIKEALGKRYYDHVVKSVADQNVDFRLVSPDRSVDPTAFYIMENKVWNDLFRAFMNDTQSPAWRELDEWRVKFPSWAVKSEWMKGTSIPVKPEFGVANGRWPVYRVTVLEAHFCAKWMGGRLPSTQQWDRAAGFYEGSPHGPFNGEPDQWRPGEVAIDRKKDGPMEVGVAARDVSPWGCRDMAGNGREWTRTPFVRTGEVPIADPKPDDLVWLRGRDFTRLRPLGKPSENTDSERYDSALPNTSFRVVLEP